jgi:hypothetical protein
MIYLESLLQGTISSKGLIGLNSTISFLSTGCTYCIVNVDHARYLFCLVGLWCLMPLSTIFQLYRGTQFYWWRKLEYRVNHQPVPSH